MGKKSLNELFRKYLVKKHTTKKNQINKNKDIEGILVDSMIEVFKNNITHQLGNFGYLKKNKKMVDSKMETTIDFVPNEDFVTKLGKKYLMVQKQKRMKRRMTILTTIIVILLLLLLSGLGFSAIYYNNEIGNFVKKMEIEAQKIASKKSETTTTSTSQTQTNDMSSDSKIIKKETIDFKDKEVHTNTDKSIIIKTQAVNDTNLKAGESQTEVVEIDGKLYDKNLYIIKKGDTLWDIASKFLFDPFKWPNIHKDNPYITNPDLILPNLKLIIYRLKK